MARKKRTIYDNDGTVVEQTIGIGEEVSVFKKTTELDSVDSIYGKEFDTSDILDSFIGYMNPRIDISSIEDDGEGSKCLICGTATNKNIRKICFECMKKYSNQLYPKMKNSIRNHENKIVF